MQFTCSREKVEVCSKHYRQLHRLKNEVLCFVCKKHQPCKSSFHRPVNAQLLQRGDHDDVGQAGLLSACPCHACYVKNTGASDAPESRDATLDTIIQEQIDEIDQLSHLSPSSGGPVLLLAKANITLMVAKKLRGNEGVLLADAFDQLNSFLEEKNAMPLTKSSSLRSHLQQVLESHLDVVYVKGSRLPGQLLVRKGGDLHHALYCALSDSHSSRKDNQPLTYNTVDGTPQASTSQLPGEDIFLEGWNTL